MLNKSKIKMGSNRSFGLVFFVVFIMIALWSFRGDLNQIKILPLFISVFFLVLGLLNSKILTPLNKIWFKFGIFLGNIIAPLVMGIVFFLVVTPTGMIIKMFGKDLLGLKFDHKKHSYWIKRDKTNTTMRKQF